MQAVDEVRAVPRLEQKPTDSIGSHVELPLTPNSSHQGEMAGQEIPMSQLNGDTTDNKESTRNTEQPRDGQDVAKESSQMVSRLYGDTTDIKETVSPSNGEEKPRVMSELCACGDPTDPDALTRLYENSENKKQYDEDKQSTSVLYQAGTPPDEGDQIGDMSATGARVINEAPGKCRDCAEIYEGGSTTSGVYLVTLQNNTPVEVYCDMDTDGGGWTIIQRRIDGTVPFNRTWEDYKQGFGNKDGEHWLGNDNIHLLTNQKDYRLQLFFLSQRKQKNLTFTCSRGFFKVSNEKSNYTLDYRKGKPSGACDHLIKSAFRQAFSTVDRDNDNLPFSCAKLYGGGWWYTYVMFSVPRDKMLAE
ncbi:PREDICTED: ficolin-1-like [Branchiostoma belcheri]|uniref:Ficolin-1-like n=1 Tax=Branchiostoma belcheri TaxID=7741 RepID=A0A6P5A1A0_BRABE|nr:PREDICTED: ficolin-1-like [Branchiostoma belcheri]